MVDVRLIDANKLMKKSRRMYAPDEIDSIAPVATSCVTVNDIHRAPVVDAVPVVHARWVHDDLGHTYCSKCHERLPYIHCYSEEPCSDYDEEWDEEIPETRYCPNCGAIMDGDERES